VVTKLNISFTTLIQILNIHQWTGHKFAEIFTNKQKAEKLAETKTRKNVLKCRQW